tara:strand:+ start:723 stop:1439 length:717 start_codon:yes stop_codon:yes gene_type:complete
MKIQFDLKLVLLLSIFFLNSVLSQNKKVNEILLKSLDAHGGENLNKIQRIKYFKTTYTYDESGTIKKEDKQKITHQFDPYETVMESKNKFIKSNGIITEITENERPVNDLESINKAKSLIDGAFYVFWQPMKLKDSGTIIKYMGITRLPNKKKVFSLKVSYPDGTDTWNFYFDITSYLLIGTEVNHNNKISLIYTTDFNTTEDGIFHYKRDSYKVTKNRSKLSIQASYIYEILNIVKE